MPSLRKYDEQVHEVERGTFSPLIFSCSGGMGPTATIVFKRIATLISEKRGHPYCHVLYWIRCKLCYSLLCSAVMYLRGSRSNYHKHNLGDPSIDLACSESRLYHQIFVILFVIIVYYTQMILFHSKKKFLQILY